MQGKWKYFQHDWKSNKITEILKKFTWVKLAPECSSTIFILLQCHFCYLFHSFVTEIFRFWNLHVNSISKFNLVNYLRKLITKILVITEKLIEVLFEIERYYTFYFHKFLCLYQVHHLFAFLYINTHLSIKRVHTEYWLLQIKLDVQNKLCEMYCLFIFHAATIWSLSFFHHLPFLC